MELTEKEDNQQLAKLLPEIRKGFDILSSTSFQAFEDSLDKVTNKAIGNLESIIDDGSLALDPEQLVRAVDTLTRAKIGIADSRRKMLETLIKGEVMMKALEPPKDDKNKNSVLDEYFSKQQKKVSTVAGVNSVFEDIEKST